MCCTFNRQVRIVVLRLTVLLLREVQIVVLRLTVLLLREVQIVVLRLTVLLLREVQIVVLRLSVLLMRGEVGGDGSLNELFLLKILQVHRIYFFNTLCSPNPKIIF